MHCLRFSAALITTSMIHSTYTYLLTTVLICFKCTPTFGDSIQIKTQEPSQKSVCRCDSEIQRPSLAKFRYYQLINISGRDRDIRTLISVKCTQVCRFVGNNSAADATSLPVSLVLCLSDTHWRIPHKRCLPII